MRRAAAILGLLTLFGGLVCAEITTRGSFSMADMIDERR
jgi:hypothetical protein